MLKKLLIPSFIFAASFALGAGGCSSSSTPTPKDGGAGTGGATAGTGGGTAGSDAGTDATGVAGTDGGAGTTGAAGADAGTDATGAAGTDGGTDATGAAGSDAGTDSGTDAGTVSLSTLEAECVTKRADGNMSVPFTAAEFCAVYADLCGATTFTNMLTPTDCVATYNSWATQKVTGMPTVAVQSCTTYHLCNAMTMDKTIHCPHAAATVASAVCAPAN